jgi:hypothetical protein
MTLKAALPSNWSSKRWLVPLSASVFGILLALCIGWAYHSNLLTASGQSNHPYTALYFAQPKQLAHTAQPGQVIAIPFTVANHEQSSVVYHYTIAMQHGSEGGTLTHGTISLDAGASTTQQATVHIPDTAKTAIISVQLTDQKQLIQHRVVIQ